MIIDFHCDLLDYMLLNEKNTAFDKNFEASIDKSLIGTIKTQILAMFTRNIESSDLLRLDYIKSYLKIKNVSKLNFLYSIENANLILGEKDNINDLEKNLNQLIFSNQRPVYISLTWVGTNRFGGGDTCKENTGLTKDGQKLLYLMDKYKIAVDLSHSSLKLMSDVFNFKKINGLKLKVICSHSNFRGVLDINRNINDDTALKIKENSGVVGLNLVSRLLGGSSVNELIKQISYAISLGLKDQIVLGADYYAFHTLTKDQINPMTPKSGAFIKEFSDSSKLKDMQNMLLDSFDAEIVEKFLYKNARSFLIDNNFNVIKD